jgi:uncharacterized membrane protein
MSKQRLTITSWIVAALYTSLSLQFSLAPEAVAGKGAMITLLPLVFVFVHGSVAYRFRDVCFFAAVTMVVSNLSENTSILTGFPFGRYYYTDILGPKLFLVPLLVGPAYLGTGYLSWMLARIILGASGSGVAGRERFTVPLLASFIMVSWDLAMDPVTATINRQWIWLDGGGYFGVPFSNFMGWFFTVYVFFQIFALYLRRRHVIYASVQPETRGYWLQAVLLYAVTGVKFPLNILTHTSAQTIADATGVLWRTQDIYLTSGLVSLFTMFAFIVLGLVKLAELSPAPRRIVQAQAV